MDSQWFACRDDTQAHGQIFARLMVKSCPRNQIANGSGQQSISQATNHCLAVLCTQPSPTLKDLLIEINTFGGLDLCWNRQGDLCCENSSTQTKKNVVPQNARRNVCEVSCRLVSPAISVSADF